MRISRSGHDVTVLSPEQISALAAKLSPEERRVILDAGTEHAFCGTLLDNHRMGVYCCRLCELPLFASDAKFDSGTGWPSFARPFDPEHVALVSDHEARCARCGAHLGHLFGDGPPPSRLRFCVNSTALTFTEQI